MFVSVFLIFVFFEFSYSQSTSMTNLTVHLGDKHEITLSSESAIDKQRKIKDVFFPSSSSPKPNRSEVKNSQFIFARQVALWLCRALAPLSTVENSGFKAFWTFVNTPYELPSRSTIAIGAIDDLYVCCKDKLIERLTNSPSHATITFDGWTDNHKRISYVTYTYHYTENWRMKTAVLKTASFPHPHTSERIKEDYEETLAEFNVLNKNLTVVTDGASSMKKASELLQVYRFYCLGHIMHLLITKDLLKHKDMQPLRDLNLKMRKIHKKLMYKHEELRELNDESIQNKILGIIEEHKEIGAYFFNNCFFFFFLLSIMNLSFSAFVQKIFWMPRSATI